MFERILFPLDGSQLAEAAIPYGAELAARLGSELILFHVCAKEHQPFKNMHQLYLREIVNGLERYMEKRFPRCEDWAVRSETIVGEAADAICEYAEKNDIRLIVMAAHGGSGLKYWAVGSVADKVVRAIDIPMLLIRVKEGRTIEGKKRLINRVLLPLDGSDTSEIAVPYAGELAERLKASITLYQMAEERFFPSDFDGSAPLATNPVLAAEEKRVRAYLTGIERILRQKGIPVTHRVTQGVDAAAEILEQGEKTKADLVVMASRGRSKIVRWVFGSVAHKILFEGDSPLLLVRKAPD
ncbi:MAG: universal stress protein [Dehalococcoidales bacterium]